MLVSLNFVEKFISLPKIEKVIEVNNKKIVSKIFDITKIEPILTRQGFEVEQIKNIGENFVNIVVGKIVVAKPHPNATKLQICLVDVGEENLRQIVCGAQNARENLYVAVALPGTKLPNGLEIKPSIIRDIESFGMLCSREELGLPINKDIDGEGIWELENEAQGGKYSQELNKDIGFPVHHSLGLIDILLDIGVTPNRPDMLCHQGVARELATGFGYANIPFKLKNPYYTKEKSLQEEKIKSDSINNSFINIENFIFSAENNLNASAFFMMIDNVKVTSSPAWLRNLLESLGQASINNVVDASNYVLLAYGQPNHAFDFNKIHCENNNKKLILRYAESNEPFLGLDGKTRQLENSDCIVADTKEVHALLGVLGGENSKVINETSRIVVEFANPNPVSIRRTSRKYSKQTEASFLFEKGIDKSARFLACCEFFAILKSLCPEKIKYIGAAHSKTVENIPVLTSEFNSKEITFSSSDQKRVLGENIISFQAQLNILKSLGFLISSQSENSAQITVPHWRSYDIFNENDLVEECIRVVGIDLVPAQPMVITNEVKKDDPHFLFIEKLCSRAANLGYHEVMSLHFMRDDDFKKCNLNSINSLGEPLAILNPILGDEPLLHTTLIPDLLRKVNKNLNHGIKKGQLFNSCRTYQNYSKNGSRVFIQNGINTKFQSNLAEPIVNNLQEYSAKFEYKYCKDEKTTRPAETPKLAGVIFGAKEEKTWQNNAETNWFIQDIMAHVIELARSCNVQLEFNKVTDESHPMANALHPGRRVQFFVSQNEQTLPIGWCGEFHPKVLRNYEIEVPCFGFEINVGNLMHASNQSNKFIKSIFNEQKFPTVLRDFAFLIDDKITANEINLSIKNSLKEITSAQIPVTLSDIYIFDIYKGKNVMQGKKSITFKLSLEPTSRTLTEKEIQIISDIVIETIKTKLDGQLRG